MTYSAISQHRSDEWYDVPSALRILECSRRTLYRYMDLGLIFFTYYRMANTKCIHRSIPASEIRRLRGSLKLKRWPIRRNTSSSSVVWLHPISLYPDIEESGSATLDEPSEYGDSKKTVFGVNNIRWERSDRLFATAN